MFVAAVIATIGLVTSPARSAPSCAEVFTSAAAKPSRFSGALDTLLSIAEGKGRPFDMATFEHERTRYQAEMAIWRDSGPSPSTPKSTEAKLAFFEVVSAAEAAGVRPLALGEWLRSATPEQIRPVRRALDKLRFENQADASRVDDAFVLLYLSTHADPFSFDRLLGASFKDKLQGLRQPDARLLPTAVRNAIVARVENDLGGKNILSALDKLGLLRQPGLREKFIRNLCKHPNGVATISALAINAFQFMMTSTVFGQGLAFKLPDYSTMKTKPLSPQLVQLIEANGFDAAYPFLKQHYGSRPQFDLAWSLARRLAIMGLMAYILSSYPDQLLASLVPPWVADPDDDTTELMGKAYDYWRGVIEIRLGRRSLHDDPMIKELEKLGAEGLDSPPADEDLPTDPNQ